MFSNQYTKQILMMWRQEANISLTPTSCVTTHINSPINARCLKVQRTSGLLEIKKSACKTKQITNKHKGKYWRNT